MADKKISFRTLVEAVAGPEPVPVAYRFARGSLKKDSGPRSGIYDPSLSTPPSPETQSLWLWDTGDPILFDDGQEIIQ